MASPAAVGGSLLGAGAIGVGSAYLAGAFEGSNNSEPSSLLLSKDSTFSTYTDSNVIGKIYGNYLVAPIGSQGEGTSATNNGE